MAYLFLFPDVGFYFSDLIEQFCGFFVFVFFPCHYSHVAFGNDWTSSIDRVVIIVFTYKDEKKKITECDFLNVWDFLIPGRLFCHFRGEIVKNMTFHCVRSAKSSYREGLLRLEVILLLRNFRYWWLHIFRVIVREKVKAMECWAGNRAAHTSSDVVFFFWRALLRRYGTFLVFLDCQGTIKKWDCAFWRELFEKTLFWSLCNFRVIVVSTFGKAICFPDVEKKQAELKCYVLYKNLSLCVLEVELWI